MKTNQTQKNTPDGIFKTILMNHLSGRGKSAKKCYLEIYLQSLNEAYKLLEEATLLFDNRSYQRSYFLGFSALEEISKSQLAADVYTGFIKEDEFKKIHRDHKEKISRVKWIQIDGNLYPCFRGDDIRINDFDFQKKLKSMYVDVNFGTEKTSSPTNSVSKEDAENIIKAVRVGLYRIHQVTEENGEQIGTKGFMK